MAFKNKLRNWTRSITTFTFRETAVYQNAYFYEQDNRELRQWEHSNIKFFLIKWFRKILRPIFCGHKVLEYFFLRILSEIAKIYVAKRIDFLCSRKYYYRKNFKNVQIHKLMSQKLFRILCRKFEKKRKEFGKIFLIKVSFFIAFDKLFMGRKFYIPYLQSFRVKSPTRVHPRNVLNK